MNAELVHGRRWWAGGAGRDLVVDPEGLSAHFCCVTLRLWIPALMQIVNVVAIIAKIGLLEI